MSNKTIVCVKDFEKHAEEVLDGRVWAFFSQGAERERTLRENEWSFSRYKLIPRLLRNTRERDLGVSVLGERLAFPIAAAPTALQKLAHPEGEIAAARAAAKLGTLYTLSSVSNTSLEDVASCAPTSPRWMQMYLLKDRVITEHMIRRAESHGYKALVLTVDAPVLGLRLREERTGLELPPHLSAPNFEISMNATEIRDAMGQHQLSDTLTWDDVAWIRSFTRLPVVLKGIITVEDAILAADYGAAAVWVSNHGGRQIDGTNTALDVLEDIATALKDRQCEVYADGGVRWGTDVLKALALGARAVFVGRPVLWGLAHSGEEGVTKVFQMLRDELDKAMQLMGCASISDIGPHLLKNRILARI